MSLSRIDHLFKAVRDQRAPTDEPHVGAALGDRAEEVGLVKGVGMHQAMIAQRGFGVSMRAPIRRSPAVMRFEKFLRARCCLGETPARRKVDDG